MKLFAIDNGETDWFFAPDEDAAWTQHCQIYGDAYPRDDARISEVPREKWATIMIDDDGVRRSALEIFERERNGDMPFMLGSTCI